MANTLYDALFAPLKERQTVLLDLPGGDRLTGDAFLRMVARASHALRAAGVQTGDRVAVQVAKSPQALAVYGAAVALGAVFLPLNTAYTAADVLLHALPIFHTHGLFVATNISLLTGGRMIFLPGFDSEQVLAALPRATAMMGVPTFYTRLLEEARLTRDLCAGMRLFVSGSAPLLAETHRAFQARTGHRILERYGMTETNMNTSNPYDGLRKPGSVGFPLPGVDLRIADPESGMVLPQGEIGGIEVKGPNVFGGYWKMPEKTA